MTTSRVMPALATLTALAVLTGCTHSSAGSPAVTTPAAAPSSSVATSEVAPPSSASATPTSPTPTPTSSPATPTPAPSSTAAQAVSCSASQLSVGVVKGGASLGQEIAIVTFTNTTSTPCTVQGYPSAQLEDGSGKTIGTPATHVAGATTAVLLKAHGSAQATLTAVTTCNAPESTAVRIALATAPGATEVPVALRACTLQITPVAKP